MKRLLAYLFIVLGLGLTFNVNAEVTSVNELSQQQINFENGKEVRVKFCFREINLKSYEEWGSNPFQIVLADINCKDLWNGGYSSIGSFDPIYRIPYEKYLDLASSVGYKKNFKICYRPEKKQIKSNADKEFLNILSDCSIMDGYELSFVGSGNSSDIFVKKQTQIAKAEPSQTQDSFLTFTKVKYIGWKYSEELRNREYKFKLNNNSTCEYYYKKDSSSEEIFYPASVENCFYTKYDTSGCLLYTSDAADE